MRLFSIIILLFLFGCPHPVEVSSTTKSVIRAGNFGHTKFATTTEVTPGKVTTENSPTGKVYVLHEMKVQAMGVPPGAKVELGGSGTNGMGLIGIMISSSVPVLLGLDEKGEFDLVCSGKQLYVTADQKMVIPEEGFYQVQQTKKVFQELIIMTFSNESLHKIRNAQLIQFKVCDIFITLDKTQLPALRDYLRKVLLPVTDNLIRL